MEKHSYSNALERAFLLLKAKNIDISVASYLMEEMLHWTHTKFVLHQDEMMDEVEFNRFFDMIERASKSEPPQYILGKAWFYGREFKVTTDTLIPRQETEELVAKILEDISDTKNLNILDIGTGTGNIPITLALEKPDSNYLGLDISKAALKVAQINATELKADVDFIYSDLFEGLKKKKFDVIISNPPYIAQDERDVMDASVLKYEPELALFAEDEGLAIYRKIFAQLDEYLNPEGCAYFEYGYLQKEKLSQIINNQLPQFAVEFYQDLTGNWRYLKLYRKKG